MKGFAITAFDGIKAALSSGDFALAAKILWLSLQVAWQKGISTLLGYWIGFKKSFMTVTLETFYGALSLITDAWAGLKSAWVGTIGFLKKGWSGFTGMIMKAWNHTFGFMMKAWIRLKGLFDDSINVDAEIAKIDQGTADKNAEQDADYAKTEADTKKQQAQIEQRRQIEQEAIAQAMVDDLQQHENQYAKELAKSQQALADAKREWAAAISEAKNKPAETKKPESSPLQDAIDKLKNAGDTVSNAQGKIQVQGSFYANAISSLASGTAADRTAKASEEIKKNTKKTNQLLENSSGLTFG